MRSEDGTFWILTSPEKYEVVKQVLEGRKIALTSANLTKIPQSTVKLLGKEAEQMLKLMESIEDHDDVQNVYANFDIPDEVMESVSRE